MYLKFNFFYTPHIDFFNNKNTSQPYYENAFLNHNFENKKQKKDVF